MIPYLRTDHLENQTHTLKAAHTYVAKIYVYTFVIKSFLAWHQDAYQMFGQNLPV